MTDRKIEDAVFASQALMAAQETMWCYATMFNRALCEQSKMCVCTNCLEVFPAGEVEEWSDGGQTALCPRCGCDGVVPQASGLPMSPEYWERLRSAIGGRDLSPYGYGGSLAVLGSLTAQSAFPACYHGLEGLGAANVGFVQGISRCGEPYEADVWLDGEDVWATFVLPDMDSCRCYGEGEAVSGPRKADWHSHIVRGMEERDPGEYPPSLARYEKWLEGAGLVEYAVKQRRSDMRSLIDAEGNSVVAVSVCLHCGGRALAHLGFRLMAFPTRHGQAGCAKEQVQTR